MSIMENGTGVYYQAMPAVGPDGKNVMKLIPVQKVNGKFVQTHVLTARNDCQPQVYSQTAHLSPLNLQQQKLPTLQPTADGRFILKTPPEGNTLLNTVKSQATNHVFVIKRPASQVGTSLLTPKLTQSALQLPSSKTVTVINTPQQPVAVSSPVLSSGHYLQIPANATVRTVPASALPQSIKNQICTSSNVLSNPAKGLPTVVYVSPVKSLKLGSSQQLPGLTKISELSQTFGHTPSTSSAKNLNVSSASSPKADPAVTTPMKWVVHEGTGNSAPCLIPVTSPNATSDILKAVKQMETGKLGKQVLPGEPVSTHAVQEKINPGKDNALVMCNGKVYFVAKKSSETTKDVLSCVGNDEVRSSAPPSSAVAGSCTSNKVSRQDPVNTEFSKKPNEIIDLCDDEEESSTSIQSGRVAVESETMGENDEDSNVIFVSYIPPKSETETSKEVPEKAAKDSCEKNADSPQCDVGNVQKGCELNRTNSYVIDLDIITCQDDESVNRGGAVSEQPKEVCDQGTEVTEKISVNLVSQCRQDSEAVNKMSLETPTFDHIHQQKSDSELRQIFGITSDVRICLERTNQAKEPCPRSGNMSINKRTLDGIRKLIKESQIELKIKQLIQGKVPDSKEENGREDAKRIRLEQDGQSMCLDKSLYSVIEGTVKCHDKMQSPSTDGCVDNMVVSHCQGPEAETQSTSDSSAVTVQTSEPVCSSTTLFQSLQTQTENCSFTSRKTPPRQSKGSGRVCTACPCGTKVGAMTANSSSKPQEKYQANVLTDSNTVCKIAEEVPKNSVSSPPKSNSVLEKSESKMVPTSQSHKKPGKDSLHTAVLSCKQIDGGTQPELNSKGTTCSRSRDNAQGMSCKNGTADPVEAPVHEPEEQKEEEVKAHSSLEGDTFGMDEKMHSDFYSSIMLDPEEIKRRERIKRLKDLLKEKEAALEKLRQNL